MADLMSKKSFTDSNISTSAQSIPHLTEGQIACLRLVVQHHTSKEIARKLGISPFTVDQRLDAARRKMNAASRKDAAKIFAALEMESISQPLVYEPLALEAAYFPASQTTSEGRAGIGFACRLAKILSFVSRLPIGGERHELSSREILFHVLNIAFFSSLVIAIAFVIYTSAF